MICPQVTSVDHTDDAGRVSSKPYHAMVHKDGETNVRKNEEDA